MPAPTLALKLLSTLYGAVERAERAYRVEREYLGDLFAEARAKYEADRAWVARGDIVRSPSTATAAPEPAQELASHRVERSA